MDAIYFILGDVWKLTEDERIRITDTNLNCLPRKVRKLLQYNLMDLFEEYTEPKKHTSKKTPSKKD